MYVILIGRKLFSFEKHGLWLDWSVSKCMLYVVQVTVHRDLIRQTRSSYRGGNDWQILILFAG